MEGKEGCNIKGGHSNNFIISKELSSDQMTFAFSQSIYIWVNGEVVEMCNVELS